MLADRSWQEHRRMVTKHSLPNTIYSVYHHIIPFNKPLAQSVIIPFNTAVMMTVQFACFAPIHDRTLHWTKLELSFSYLHRSLTKALVPKRQKSLAQCHSVPNSWHKNPWATAQGLLCCSPGYRAAVNQHTPSLAAANF